MTQLTAVAKGHAPTCPAGNAYSPGAKTCATCGGDLENPPATLREAVARFGWGDDASVTEPEWWPDGVEWSPAREKQVVDTYYVSSPPDQTRIDWGILEEWQREAWVRQVLGTDRGDG